LGRFVASHVDDVHPVVGSIIRLAASKSAADAYRGLYRLEELKRAAATQWAGSRRDAAADGRDDLHEGCRRGRSDQAEHQSRLLHELREPDGSRGGRRAGGLPRDGLPFGVSLVGPAFSDAALLALASRYAGGAAPAPGEAPGCIHVAVVGAHLTGQPLNRQLTERGARLVQSCRTSPEYRFYALANTTPPKPGLVREPGFDGPGSRSRSGPCRRITSAASWPVCPRRSASAACSSIPASG
jgi:allophanate hydrolase